MLEYPQSGERIRRRRKIWPPRAAQPNRKRMEFLDGKLTREAQYFGDPFEPAPSRAQRVERMP